MQRSQKEVTGFLAYMSSTFDTDSSNISSAAVQRITVIVNTEWTAHVGGQMVWSLVNDNFQFASLDSVDDIEVQRLKCSSKNL